MKEISKLYWFIKNLFRYALVNKIPRSWDFQGPEDYWKKMIQEGVRVDISYPRIVEISEQIIKDKSRVLDVGCGSGAFLKALKRNKDILGLGIDSSITAITIAKNNGVNARIFDFLAGNLKELGEFDYVTCFEVLEHIQNAEYFIKRLVSTFDKAQFIFSIPNTGFIYHRIRLLLGCFPKQWVIHPAEHIRFWTKKDFKLVLENLGLQIIKIYAASTPIFLSRKYPGLFSESLIFHLKNL
ncbi:MAG: methyltransferase domain-containing protein [Candidatus Omnitrophica bacterium]|jgi:methionine biosynthesis protein MetW|nr:methyltransferase domain-containing protein [Candidatus Omnitrophota bacterium]